MTNVWKNLKGLEELNDTELTRTEGGAKPTIDSKGIVKGDIGPINPTTGTGPTFPTSTGGPLMSPEGCTRPV
jgi:hypothetical protein